MKKVVSSEGKGSQVDWQGNEKKGIYATNYLSSCHKRVYENWTFLYNGIKDACKQVAIRSLWKMSHWGAHLGYRTGSTRLLNAMLEYQSGISIAKMRVTDLHLAASLGTIADVKAAIDKGSNVHAREWDGWTPLHFSAQTTGQGVDLLLSKGADMEAKTRLGFTPLHIAAEGNNQGAISSLLKAGANIEAKDQNGRTPLHLAVLTQNKESIRTLISKGANIHAPDSEGASPIGSAFNSGRIDIPALLHNAERHPAFTSKETLHAYFEKIFPPSRNQLPKDLIWLEKMKLQLDGGKNPFEELCPLFEQCGPISYAENAKALQTLQGNSSTPPSLEAILNCLIQYSPLFAKALDLSTQLQLLIINEVTQDPTREISLASYVFNSHKIVIDSRLDTYWKASSLIFETLNALQRKRYLELIRLAQTGFLTREEFAVLTEYCELDTVIWHDRIIGEKSPLQNHDTFAKYWNTANVPLCLGGSSKKRIHADYYRKQWDLLYGFTYLKRHRGKLEPQPPHAHKPRTAITPQKAAFPVEKIT